MEETKSHLIAKLAIIDRNLDELQEEYGDLPMKLKEQEDKVKELKETVEETQQILSEIKEFCSDTKETLVTLKDKEDKLSKQQFQVRNNKEFDAITSEIKHIKEEHRMLTEKLRQEGIKQENLNRILEEQKEEYETEKSNLDELEAEVKELSKEQEDEVEEFTDKRDKIVEKLRKDDYHEYKRIRQYHSEAAVPVKRNSCSGCFSAIPPQIIVEMRNDFETMYKCENCGRILIPDDIIFDDEIVEDL